MNSNYWIHYNNFNITLLITPKVKTWFKLFLFHLRWTSANLFSSFLLLFSLLAVTFWLRDLEMETYSTIFARNKINSLETFGTLTEKQILSLVKNVEDAEKMQTGIQEMKEFQFYYSSAGSILVELGLEKVCCLLFKFFFYILQNMWLVDCKDMVEDIFWLSRSSSITFCSLLGKHFLFFYSYHSY